MDFLDRLVDVLAIIVGLTLIIFPGILGKTELTPRQKRFTKMVGKTVARIIYFLIGVGLLIYAGFAFNLL